MRLLAPLLLLLLLPAQPLTAQEAHREILGRKFQEELEAVVDAFDGVGGVHVVDLAEGQHFDVNGDMVFPQASAISFASFSPSNFDATLGRSCFLRSRQESIPCSTNRLRRCSIWPIDTPRPSAICSSAQFGPSASAISSVWA